MDRKLGVLCAGLKVLAKRKILDPAGKRAPAIQSEVTLLTESSKYKMHLLYLTRLFQPYRLFSSD
jgi:hypothetical protein